MGAIALWAAVRGKYVGRGSTKLQDLCEYIWNAAAPTEPSGGGWERQIRDVREGKFATLSNVTTNQILSAKKTIRLILGMHGLKPPLDNMDIKLPGKV
mgnify:CR=1 FL=1